MIRPLRRFLAASAGAWAAVLFLAFTLGLTPSAALSLVQTAQIADNAVTLAKEATMAAATVQGRASGAGTGTVTALTGTQLAVIVDPATSTTLGTTKLKPFPLTYYFTGSGSGTAWTNATAATSEWLAGTWRKAYDATNFTEVHLELWARSGAPASGFVVGLECSSDGTNWLFVDDGASAGTTASPTDYGTHAPVATWASSAGFESTGWTTIHANCRNDYWWRLVGDNGDGAADPAAGHADIWFR